MYSWHCLICAAVRIVLSYVLQIIRTAVQYLYCCRVHTYYKVVVGSVTRQSGLERETRYDTVDDSVYSQSVHHMICTAAAVVILSHDERARMLRRTWLVESKNSSVDFYRKNATVSRTQNTRMVCTVVDDTHTTRTNTAISKSVLSASGILR